MPCRDDRDDCRLTQSDVTYAATAAAEQVRKELDPLLCEACTLIEEAGFSSKMTPELKKWFTSHEKCEEDRVRYEAALKLSGRERRLFGINLESLKSKVKPRR